MANHTPGPWAYHSWGEKASGKRFSIETADHKHGLASIAPNINASTLLTMEQHEANARLIAEAPAMYEALIRLQHTLEYVNPDDAKFVAGVLNRVEGRSDLTSDGRLTAIADERSAT